MNANVEIAWLKEAFLEHCRRETADVPSAHDAGRLWNLFWRDICRIKGREKKRRSRLREKV